jgi:hypothetical protein
LNKKRKGKNMKRQYINLDADEGVFFSKELEYLKARTYDRLYPELLARRLFPVDSSADPGASTITYQSWDHVGAAKLIHSYAMDLPNIDVTAKEITRKVYGEGAAFGYSLQDIRAARFAGKPLEQRKADATRRQMMQLENKIAFHGNDATLGVPGTDIPGFINAPNTTSVTIPDGDTPDTRWLDDAGAALKTPDQIIADICLMSTTVRDTTNGVETPNTLLLPEAQYGHISCTPRSSTSDTTILNFVLQSNAWISEIIPVYNLKDAAPASGSYEGQDCMILYDRSPDKLTLEVPQDFEMLPVQERALYFEVPTHARTAGVIIYYPKSVAQGNGI